MQTIFILATIFTLLGLSHAECIIHPGFRFPRNYECLVPEGRLFFRGDGNLVIENINGNLIWQTNTHGIGETAIFEPNGNLVIFNLGVIPVWQSHTYGRGKVLIFQNDLSLVILDNLDRLVWRSTFNN